MSDIRCDENCPACTYTLQKEKNLLKGKVLPCSECKKKFVGNCLHLVGGNYFCPRCASIQRGQYWDDSHWVYQMLATMPSAFFSSTIARIG
jgi:hypothetical protein